MYVPMLWFQQEVNLTQEYASQIKLLVLLPPIGTGICISLAVVGILLIVISAVLFFRQKREDEQALISKTQSRDGDIASNEE